MRKHYVFAMLMAAMLLPWAHAAAQETTVAEGTNTSKFVPCGLNRYGWQSEMMYPAEMLEEMSGVEITALTFYFQQSSAQGTLNNVTVRIDEPQNTSAYVSTGNNTGTGMKLSASTTTYFSGTLTASNGILEIELDEPYAYNGGALCINLFSSSSPGMGDYDFVGQNQSVNSSCHDWSISNPTWCSYNAYTFLPQCTFTHTGGGADICRRVSNLTASQPTSDGATISFTGREEHTSYTMVVKTTQTTPTEDDEEIDLDDETSYVLEDLSPLTTYYVYVRGNCSDGESGWSYTSFRTSCGLIAHSALPWTENMDSYTNTQSASYSTQMQLDCWNILGHTGSSGYYYPYIMSSNNHTEGGTNCLFFSSGAGNTMFVLPEFEDGLSSLVFSMWLKTSGSGNSLAVGYCTDPTDISTFVAVNTVPASALSNVFTEIETYYTEDVEGARIAFKPLGSSGFYMDDFTVRENNGCNRPLGISFSNIGTTEATITVNGDAEAYRVYFTTGTVTDSLDIDSESGTIEGLAASTTYNVSVVALCDGGTKSLPRTGAFTTACGAIGTLPWEDGFESGTYSTTPNCWTNLSNGTTSTNYQFVYNSGAHSGSQCLRFNYSSASGNVIMLPQFEAEINTLAISFWHRPESNTNYNMGTFEVGYVADPDDATTFVAVESWPYSDFTSTSYRQEEDITFAAAPDGARIAFRHRAATLNWYWHVDDVMVYEAPSCTRPAITLDAVEGESATISLADANGVGHYMVYIVNGTNVDSVEVQDESHTFENLSPSTPYTLQAYTLCTDGTRTMPTTVAFTTSCMAITTLPWTEDFESYTGASSSSSSASITELPCYDVTGNNGYTSYVSTAYNHTSSSTGNCVRYYGNTSSYPVYFTLPPFDGGIGGKMFSCWMRTTNAETAYIGIGYMTDPSNPATYTEVTQGRCSASNTWEYVDAAFDATATGRITLRYYGSSSDIHLDDFTVDVTPDCMRPNSVTISDIVEGGFTVNINDVNETGQYRIYKTPTGGTTDSVDVNGNSYTFTGLEPSTRYRISVATICDGGALTHTTSTEAITPCSPITNLPWSESFEDWDLPSSSVPTHDCWNIYEYTSGSHYPYLVGVAHTGDKGLVYRASAGQSCMMVLPAFSHEPSELLVSIWVYTMSGTCSIDVGYVTNPADSSTFVKVNSIDCSSNAISEWTELITTYPDSATGYVAVRLNAQGDNGARLDDISVMLNNGCTRPESVAIADITTTSASFTITDSEDAGSYIIVLNDGTTADTVHLDGTNTAEVTTLSSGTHYDVSVMSSCEGGYSMPIFTSFATGCESYPIPYSTSFESDALSEAPICWTAVNGDVYVRNSSSGNSSGIHTGSQYLDFRGTYNNIVALPVFDDEVNTLQIRLWTRPENPYNSNCGTFHVGYMTDVTDASTFVSVDSWSYSTFTDMEEKVVSLASAPAGARIALRQEANSNNYYWYVDDVEVTLNNGEQPQPVGIDAASATAVRLYPNPATSSVSVEFEGQATISLLDLSGRQVLSTEAESRATFDVSTLAKGAYFVRVTSAAGTAVSKLVVK